MAFNLGGLLGGGGSAPSIDIGPLQQLVKQKAQTQKDIVGNLYGKLQPMAGDLRTQLLGAENTGIAQGEQRAQQFLKDIGETTNLQGQQLSDIAKQRVLGAVPEAQAQAREALAATGGLQRGYAGKTLAAIPQTAIQNLSQIQQGIQQDALAKKQAAQQQVFNLDEGFIQDRTGLDKDTLMEIYNSGRTDLIQQANQLLGIEGQSADDLIGLSEFQASSDLAQQQAAQQRKQSLLGAITGLTGTGLGYYLTGTPVGAAVGSQVGQNVGQLVGY